MVPLHIQLANSTLRRVIKRLLSKNEISGSGYKLGECADRYA